MARAARRPQGKRSAGAGADADITVFDPDAEWTVTPDHLHFRHKISPYLGAKLQGIVRETWLRGERVFSNGNFSDAARGRELVRR